MRCAAWPATSSSTRSITWTSTWNAPRRACSANGAKVHFAADAEEAAGPCSAILEGRGAKRVVKTKSMATEEIELGAFLERHGIESIETDLGEFVVQLDADKPSHIVKPIMHRDRREMARTFEGHGLGAYDDTPEVITRRAREYLRRKYLAADVGITGANFVSAESGRLVLVTNEGNSRFCLAATGCHIALVRDREARPARSRPRRASSTCWRARRPGSSCRSTPSSSAGPRAAGQLDGPDEMHVIFLDNGRTRVLGGDYREILRCIRCGACLNVCPVYRQASGHAYRGVYSGPVGAVLTPLLAGDRLRSWPTCRKRLQPVRRLQRGLPGQHPDPRSAAAPARPRQARRRAPGRRVAVDGLVRTPRLAPGLLAPRAFGREAAGIDSGPAAPARAARLEPEPHAAALARRRLPQVARRSRGARRSRATPATPS